MAAVDKVQTLLAKAGITVGGDKSWDIQVHDKRVYSRVFSDGSLALGESYVDGWWDSKDVAESISRILRTGFKPSSLLSPSFIWLVVRSRLLNMQTIGRSTRVAKEHYDIGNDLYERMLGPTMAYSCGYWRDATNLAEAQKAKFDLICRKLDLKNGQRILDVGCGFGTFLEHAAKNYGVSGVGLTLSKEQAAYARKRVEGLPVEIRIEDYRITKGTFDHVISIGMFEHVGYKNYLAYMKRMRELLKEDGLFLLHTIGGNRTVYAGEPWLNKYIFPGGMLPSIKQIGAAIEKKFVMEDWHNFGADYDTTLMAWLENFNAAWPELKNKYGERFYRIWIYYLSSCAAVFRARNNELWQIVLSPHGVSGGYRSVR
jgi:cyclopropane-fatty-acyl-phospholipid synthase